MVSNLFFRFIISLAFVSSFSSNVEGIISAILQRSESETGLALSDAVIDFIEAGPRINQPRLSLKENHARLSENRKMKTVKKRRRTLGLTAKEREGSENSEVSDNLESDWTQD